MACGVLGAAAVVNSKQTSGPTTRSPSRVAADPIAASQIVADRAAVGQHRLGRWFLATIPVVSLFAIAACAPATSWDPAAEEEAARLGKADSVTDPATCPDGEPRLVQGKPATWTIMVYAAADNDLEDDILRDLEEMELGHQGSANVNVLVQLDKRTEPGMWRYRIRNDSDTEVFASELVDHQDEEIDSGDYRTLAAFGDWAATCFPAERYVLVVEGHGGAWGRLQTDEVSDARLISSDANEALRMLAYDATNRSEILVTDLVKAVDSIGRATRRPEDPEFLKRLVLYGSDACLMQTLEVVYALRNEVLYVVGSEETEPEQGWPYNTVLRELTERPSQYAQMPHLLADLIVRNYGRTYGAWGGSSRSSKTTLSAIGTSFLIRARNQLRIIADLLVQLLPSISDHVWAARRDAFIFGNTYADLGLFLDRVRVELTDAGLMPAPYAHFSGDERYRTLRDAIGELRDDLWPYLVVAETADRRYEGASGLAIYLPIDPCDWNPSGSGYDGSELAVDAHWDQLMDALAEYPPVADPQRREYQGTGTISATIGSHTIANAAAYCDVVQGKLRIYTVASPRVQIVATLQDDGLVLDGAGAALPDEGMKVRYGAEPVAIDAEFSSGMPVAGGIAVDGVDTDGSTVSMTLSFECSDYADRTCSSDAPF